MMLRHALRELRGGLRHLQLFFICLMLGVGVIACIGSLAEAIRTGINGDAKALLGGDIEISQTFTELPSNATNYILFHSTDMGRVMTMRAMAQGAGNSLLVELKGVDEHYPLYGELKTTDRQRGALFFNDFHKTFYGAAIDRPLMRSLGLKPGDAFTIGKAHFKIQGVIKSEPDRGMGGLLLGPHVLTSLAGFRATGLTGPTSLVYYRYRAKLKDGTDLAAWKSGFAAIAGQPSWQIHDWRSRSPSLTLLLDRLTLFFSLTALTTLAVAGIGIGNAAGIYLWSRRETIAVMKCLGAPARHIFGVYLLQLLIVSIAAILCGMAAGTLGEMLVLHLSIHQLPIDGVPGFYPVPLLLSAAFGLLTVLLASFLPLARAANIRPLLLFRGSADPLPPYRRNWRTVLILLTLTALLIALAMLMTGAVRIPLYFAGGMIIAAWFFRRLARILTRLAAHRTSTLPPTLRMALANLTRPDTATSGMVVALGIGMTLLVALSLVSANLTRQIDDDLPTRAPAFFLADIQPSQQAVLLNQLQQMREVERVESQPVVRGHITAVNDIAADKLSIDESARWALQGERALTWTDAPPENTRIVSGTWWTPGYVGPPLVSLDAQVARGMGLSVGDTITITALDRSITATVASLRDISWGTLEMNFAMIFSPSALDGLPYTFIAATYVKPRSGGPVTDFLAKQYPDVIVVRVHDLLARLSEIVSGLAHAVMITAFVAILCGIAVMAGALHGVMQKRLPDTVILKVLGVTRKRLLAIYACEFALVLLTASLGAALLGTLAGWGLMQLMIFSHFAILPDVILATLAGSLALAIPFGLDATRTALNARPLTVLRDA